jgi:hypothetical protein
MSSTQKPVTGTVAKTHILTNGNSISQMNQSAILFYLSGNIFQVLVD